MSGTSHALAWCGSRLLPRFSSSNGGSRRDVSRSSSPGNLEGTGGCVHRLLRFFPSEVYSCWPATREDLRETSFLGRRPRNETGHWQLRPFYWPTGRRKGCFGTAGGLAISSAHPFVDSRRRPNGRQSGALCARKPLCSPPVALNPEGMLRIAQRCAFSRMALGGILRKFRARCD